MTDQNATLAAQRLRDPQRRREREAVERHRKAGDRTTEPQPTGRTRD